MPAWGADYARLLSLVKSVAVLRHARRARDEAGRLVATLDDYATVHTLVADVYRASSTGAGAKIRAVVGAVADITTVRTHATVAQVQERLSLSKTAASRHVKAALKSGWLTNAETRKGYPYQLSIGEPLPPEAGLPGPETLRCATVPDRLNRGGTPGGTPEPIDLQQQDADRSTVSPLTDDNNEHEPTEDTLVCSQPAPSPDAEEPDRDDGVVLPSPESLAIDPDDARTLAEVVARIAQGGWCVVTVPDCASTSTFTKQRPSRSLSTSSTWGS